MTTKLSLDKAGRVVIPKALRQELRLGPGDTLQLESRGDQITLRPLRPGSTQFWMGDKLPAMGIQSPQYYNDYRWQHQASEQVSLGRSFQLREKISFQIRAEFFNVFNRMFLPGPSSGNPAQTQTRSSAGVPTAGFGYINATSAGGQRNGQLVARFQF